MSSIFDVTAYGAVGNGSHDDTTAIQAAINAAVSAGGGTVYFPTGTYKTISALSLSGATGICMQGVIWSASKISCDFNGNTLEVSSGSNSLIIEKLGFFPQTTKTSGAEISAADSGALLIDECAVSDALGQPYQGIVLTGGASQYKYWIEYTEINGCADDGIVVGTDSNVVQDVYLTNVLVARCNNGVRATNVSGMNVQYLECVKNRAHGFLTYPASGQKVTSLQVVNLNCDTNGENGVALFDNGGSVTDSQFVNCWIATNAQNGLLMQGNVNGMQFANCQFLNNMYSGGEINSGQNFLFSACQFKANSQSSSNVYHGLSVYDNVSSFIIVGCMSGNIGAIANQQHTGFRIGTGCGNFQLTGNWASGNLTSQYDLYSTPSTPVLATGNI